MPRILLVDDNNTGRRAVHKFLSRLGYDVFSVPNLKEALVEAKTSSFDLLITDKNLGGWRRGVRPLLDYMQEERPGVPVLLASGEDGRQAQKELYCHGFFRKSSGSERLAAVVSELCPLS